MHGGAEVALGSNEYTAHAAVIEGVVEALDLLKKRNAGRYTTQDRITQEVLLGAAVGVAKGKVLSSVARLLNVRPQTLKKAATRMEATSKDERPSCFFLDEKSCNAYNPAWATFVTECWDSLTRASECTSDEPKDTPVDENGIRQTHRIHWINTRLDDLLPIMKVMGQEEFGASFTLSKPTMLKYKKYYHRYPGRNTCLCRYHMQFEHHFQAIRRWKAAARRAMPTSQHSALVEMPGSAQELRQFLCCPRDGKYYGWDCVYRRCNECKDKLRTPSTAAEVAAEPSIKYQAWSEVPYVCKDGRELKNHDFLPQEMKVKDYIDYKTTLSGNVQRHGLRRAKRARAGMLIGSGCANETESYIVSFALI